MGCLSKCRSGPRVLPFRRRWGSFTEPSQTCEAPTSCRDASSIGTTLCAVVLMSIRGFNLFQGSRSIGELLRRSGPRGAPILTSICSSIGTTCCAFRRRWGSSQICEASTSCRDASLGRSGPRGVRSSLEVGQSEGPFTVNDLQ